MRYNIIFLSFILFTSCSISRYNYSKIEIDINHLKEKLVEIHPSPFFSLTEDDFNHFLDSLKNDIIKDRKKSQKELYVELNKIMTKLKDGHTQLGVPSKVAFKGFFWGSKILPLVFDYKDNQLYMNVNLKTEELYERYEFRVLKINDRDVDDLLNELMTHYYGINEDFVRYQISMLALTRELWLYFDMNKRFTVEYLTPDSTIEKLSLKGISQPSYHSKYYSKLTDNKEKIIRTIESKNGFYQELVPEKLAVIRYAYFGSMQDTIFFNEVFDLAKEKNIENLILDLRGNMGGTTNLFTPILSHLTNDTIYYFSKIEYKLSNDFIENKTLGADFNYEKTDSIITINNDVFLLVDNNNDNLFKGKLYVLIDSGVFSTASAFCAIIKDYNLGVLIGEPTGGVGSSFGNSLNTKLPNSKIPLSISSGRFYRPNGDNSFTPVIPDIRISLSDNKYLYNEISKIIFQ